MSQSSSTEAQASTHADAPDRVRGCTCFRLRRLARRVTQHYDRTLAPCGLRVTQFSLLSQLMYRDGMAIGPLADALDMDRTTLTRNLKPLFDARLVEVLPGDSDGRVRVVRITTAGRIRHVEAKRLWRHAQDDVNRTWGDARVAALHRQLDDLIDTVHETTR
jgi:DNA-binding MarR family transcriptional regulator